MDGYLLSFVESHPSVHNTSKGRTLVELASSTSIRCMGTRLIPSTITSASLCGWSWMPAYPSMNVTVSPGSVVFAVNTSRVPGLFRACRVRAFRLLLECHPVGPPLMVRMADRCSSFFGIFLASLPPNIVVFSSMTPWFRAFPTILDLVLIDRVASGAFSHRSRLSTGVPLI